MSGRGISRKEDHAVIAEYHQWYYEQLIGVLQQVRRMVKSHKDIPLIYNMNNADNMADEDPRILKAMDAFLYERGHSLLERAEGVSLARAAGLGVWPYVGVYNNWPRVVPERPGLSTGDLRHRGLRRRAHYCAALRLRRAAGKPPLGPVPVLRPEALRARFRGPRMCPSLPSCMPTRNPPGHAQTGWFWSADVRSSTLGAFAACLYGHVQVSSVPQLMLDDPEQLARYRVLYLADVPQLTPRRRENLEQFVENGGGCWQASGPRSTGRRANGWNASHWKTCCASVRRSSQGELAETLNSYRCMTGGPNDLYLTPHGTPTAAAG